MRCHTFLFECGLEDGSIWFGSARFDELCLSHNSYLLEKNGWHCLSPELVKKRLRENYCR